MLRSCLCSRPPVPQGAYLPVKNSNSSVWCLIPTVVFAENPTSHSGLMVIPFATGDLLAHCRTRVLPSPYLLDASGKRVCDNILLRILSSTTLQETPLRFTSLRQLSIFANAAKMVGHHSWRNRVGHANVSRLLLAHGAHPSASASDGFSAMLKACGGGHRILVSC